jgi:tetratricopeptide (TPR) repeat protein
MRRDRLGNVLSVEDPATLRAVDDFVEGLLAYETRAEGIVAAADADKDCCMANAYAGILWMLLEAAEGPRRAARYLAAAERTAARAAPRERMTTALLRAWVDDDLPGAVRLCDAISEEFPRDLVAVKLQQYFEFNRGNAPAMLRAVLKVLDRNSDVAYAHGMAAFAYEQCHRLDEAERAAQRALEMRAKEPWAQHALGHVLLARGRVDEGARFLESAAPAWTGLNSFMLTHLWWHLALFNLSQGRESRVLEIYDKQCWGVAKHYSQDQIGAVSLLARMEIAGIEVGERWGDLAQHLMARAHDTMQPFLTLQYLYGLARAGKAEAAELLEAVRRAADAAPVHAREVWREVALPACEGLHAYARKDYETAWRRLMAVQPRLIEVGGSHAQRDLFEQILLDAAIESGREVAAQRMLELRRETDPEGVPVNTALGAVYARLGLPGLAREAQARAAATRARHGDRAQP